MFPRGESSAIPWPRIMALAVSQLVAWGVLYYAFAVIVEPMGAEAGWSKAEMHGAQSLGLLVSGLSAYAVGRRIDRQGGWGLMMTGAALGAAAVGLWSQVTELWQLYTVCVVIGLASSMALYEAAFAVAARMVPGNYRRAITAITLMGGLASTAFIPLTHWLVEALGWRQSLLVLAVIELTVCGGIAWFALRDHDGEAARTKQDQPRASVFPAVRRQPVFWLLLVSYVAFAFFYSSLLFSLLPLLAERGFAPAAAVGFYAVIGPSQVLGRLVMFATGQLIPTAYAGLLATVMPVAAMLILIGASPSSSLLILFALLFGAGMGVKTVVQATAAPEFLAIRDYGTLQGILTAPVQIVQAASPFVAALLWQWSGGYELLSYVLLGCCTVSAMTFGSAAWMSRSNTFGLRPF